MKKKKRPMIYPLRQTQARELQLPATVYLEEAGSIAITKTEATHADSLGLYFGAGGRLWNTYNEAMAGWRIWLDEPTETEREHCAWKVWWMG